MKKITLLLFMLLAFGSSFGQTEKGTWLFEVGTTPFGDNAIRHGNSTGFNLLSTDGTTLFSIGGEAGYFASDNTAIKFGLGYTNLDVTSFMSYKIGVKHYANGVVPIQLDITGATNEDLEIFPGQTVDLPDPLWLGLQVGYAAFFNENVALEPTLRYNVSLNSEYTDENILELRFNFVIFF